MKLKKGLSLVLPIILAVQLCLPVGAVNSGVVSEGTDIPTIPPISMQWINPYSDVSEDDWYYNDVQEVTKRGLMSGVSEGIFDPCGDSTRAEVATIIYRLAGSPAVKTDETKWYSAARAWAMEKGITDGINMESGIAKQDLVTMLFRYAKVSGMDVSIGDDTNILSYDDSFELPTWSIPAFQWGCAADIVRDLDNKLIPESIKTRGEVAEIIERFAKLIEK